MLSVWPRHCEKLLVNICRLSSLDLISFSDKEISPARVSDFNSECSQPSGGKEEDGF